jgi:hypothetical protein
MSSPEKKPAGPDAFKDPNLELAREIFIGMAQRVYSAPSSPEQKKPDPKALATLCFRLAEGFAAAAGETPKVKAALEAANKAGVKLDEVDISAMFGASPKP